MYRHLGETVADFEQLTIVPEGSMVVDAYGKYAKGLRDRPRFAGQMGAHPMVALPSFKHPMANFSGLWDSITSAVSTAVSTAIPKAQTAAQEALNKVAGGVAQDVLAQPKVQAAITETAKTQATQALATKIQAVAASTSTFFTKYQKPILYGSLGALGLLIAYKMFLSKRR